MTVSSPMNLSLTPLGDHALIVTLADQIDAASSRRVQAAAAWLANPPLPGVTEIVPASTTLTVFYSPTALVAASTPVATLADWLATQVRERLAALPESSLHSLPRLVEIPVCYGGEFGPDLEAVALRVKLSAAEVIARHTATEFFVLQLGFSPGFPYLHGLPAELSVPRRESPRTAVAPGSVGIANAQSCIYPLATPGGWQLIGRTPLRLFRPTEQPPALLQPGDRVKFHAITPAEFKRREAAP
jgi:inhibitor of KinA